ncbi:cytochrome c3 family protein [Leptothrix discophora]|uniref:Cytochrome c3 family protein n=1 Tax=Leptothrix discophora TaxID=89 RepID=A0ABT9G874_LEPDI|nr:cytochrome c3 family protein [Leptothrix discophora]MDP4302675.1 cytochrome c3 family protein [Leptothrix discophora]
MNRGVAIVHVNWLKVSFHQQLNDHNCMACHTGNNDKQYTCYGCHEHTPANMQAKHLEEGVSESLDNCVRCHRSTSGEDEGKGQRERGKGGRERD